MQFSSVPCLTAAAEAVCELVTKQCPEALEVVKQLPQGEFLLCLLVLNKPFPIYSHASHTHLLLVESSSCKYFNQLCSG